MTGSKITRAALRLHGRRAALVWILINFLRPLALRDSELSWSSNPLISPRFKLSDFNSLGLKSNQIRIGQSWD